MKRRNTILPIAVLLFCMSCREEIIREDLVVGDLKEMQLIDSAHITIDLTTAIQCDYDDVVDEIRYIQLGNEKGLMGEIKRIMGHKGRFYLHEETNDQVFIFDGNGKCLKKISDKGKSAKEYIAIANIDIDKSRDELIVVDRMVNRISYYDLDGNFKRREETLNIEGDLSVWLKDSTFVHSLASHQNKSSPELSGYGLMVTRGDKPISKGYSYLPVQDGYCGTYDLLHGYDGLYYRPLFTDHIYQILSDSTYRLAYHVKMDDSKWEKYKDSPEFVNLMNIKGNQIFQWITDGKDHILGCSNYAKKSRKMTVYIYDKKNNRTYLTDKPDYDKIKVLDRHWGYMVSGTYDDWFVTAIGFESVESLCERVKKGTCKVTDPKLEKIIKEMGYNSNPLLVLTKFKK